VLEFVYDMEERELRVKGSGGVANDEWFVARGACLVPGAAKVGQRRWAACQPQSLLASFSVGQEQSTQKYTIQHKAAHAPSQR